MGAEVVGTPLGSGIEPDRRAAADEQKSAERQVLTLLEAGRVDEANQLFDRLLTTPPPAGDSLVRASTLIFRAVSAWRLGRLPLALELAAEGWTELDAGPMEGAQAAQAIGRLGYLLDSIGQRGEALQMARRSVELARRSGDTDALAHCLQRLGGGLNLIAMDAGPRHRREHFAEARTHLEEALTLAREPRIYRSLLGTLARSLAGLGELDRAEELAVRTIELSEQVGYGWGACVGRWVLSIVRRQQGALPEARRHLLEAAKAAERVEDTALIQFVGMDLAEVGRDLGDTATEVAALRYVLAASNRSIDTLREGLGQALEQRRFAVRAQRLAAAAQQAAARDPLTGLANRLGLEQSAPVLLDAVVSTNRTAWLILVDIDHFKHVNDLAGHPTGDAVLRQVAKILRTECRTGDLVARWAGDEFVVLLAAHDGEHAAGPAVAERIRATVAACDWTLMGIARPRPTISIGVAGGPCDFDMLFSLADAAMYRAKRLGRNRVEVHRDPVLSQPTLSQPTLS
jgi:diguanylate cyclase (GGDEF)-like protein